MVMYIPIESELNSDRIFKSSRKIGIITKNHMFLNLGGNNIISKEQSLKSLKKNSLHPSCKKIISPWEIIIFPRYLFQTVNFSPIGWKAPRIKVFIYSWHRLRHHMTNLFMIFLETSPYTSLNPLILALLSGTDSCSLSQLPGYLV